MPLGKMDGWSWDGRGEVGASLAVLLVGVCMAGWRCVAFRGGELAGCCVRGLAHLGYCPLAEAVANAAGGGWGEHISVLDGLSWTRVVSCLVRIAGAGAMGLWWGRGRGQGQAAPQPTPALWWQLPWGTQHTVHPDDVGAGLGGLRSVSRIPKGAVPRWRSVGVVAAVCLAMVLHVERAGAVLSIESVVPANFPMSGLAFTVTVVGQEFFQNVSVFAARMGCPPFLSFISFFFSLFSLSSFSFFSFLSFLSSREDSF